MKLKFFLLFILVNSSCVFEKGKTDILIEFNSLSSKTKNTSSGNLNFTMAYLDILAGDSQTISASNGSGTYTMGAHSYGVFASGSSTFTANDSLAPISQTSSFDDTINLLSGDLAINIFGFKEEFLMDQIKTFGDQNFPKSLAQTTNGDIYSATVFIDGSGWEDWGVWKSTDNGSSWTMVDKYLPYLYGEAHTNEIAVKGNDVYVCGYVWGSGATPSSANSEWVVRKTSDGGATWQIVDHYYPTIDDNVCYSITVAPNGDIIAVGYSGSSQDAHIRLSSDDGATWQTIGVLATGHAATAVKVTPSGEVWVVVNNLMYKGIFSAGSWNWTGPVNIAPSGLDWVGYSKKGELEIVDDLTAYFAGGRLSNWEIYKTSDGGATWSRVLQQATEGAGIKVLSTGEIISIGKRFVNFSEQYIEIMVSTDGGATWNLKMSSGGNTSALIEEGINILELQDGSILAQGYRRLDSQATIFKSSDKGENWSLLSTITYYDHLYSRVEDYAEDSLGNLFTTGWVYNVEPLNPNEPYAVMKSSNNGSSWSVADYIYEAAVAHSSSEVEVNIFDHIFTNDRNGNGTEMRISTDNGVTWNTFDTTVANFQYLTTDTLGNIYYMEDLNLKRADSNGASVTNVFTFPVDGTHISFEAKGLLGTSDGSLVIYGQAFVSGVDTKLIYRSSDQGVTWSLVHSLASNSWSYSFTESSNGDFYFSIDGKVLKSDDLGVSWTEIYNNNFGSPRSILSSSDNRIFILVSDNIYSLNEATSTWFKVWDIDAVIIPNISSSIHYLFKCRFSPIGVCANVEDYTKYDGSANYLWAIKGP